MALREFRFMAICMGTGRSPYRRCSSSWRARTHASHSALSISFKLRILQLIKIGDFYDSFACRDVRKGSHNVTMVSCPCTLDVSGCVTDLAIGARQANSSDACALPKFRQRLIHVKIDESLLARVDFLIIGVLKPSYCQLTVYYSTCPTFHESGRSAHEIETCESTHTHSSSVDQEKIQTTKREEN